MGILKNLTEEYFGNTTREEDKINIDGLDVDIVSFTDNNGKKHRRGYKPKYSSVNFLSKKEKLGIFDGCPIKDEYKPKM